MIELVPHIGISIGSVIVGGAMLYHKMDKNLAVLRKEVEYLKSSHTKLKSQYSEISCHLSDLKGDLKLIKYQLGLKNEKDS